MKLPNPKKLTNKALIKFAKNEIAEWNGFLKKLKANTEIIPRCMARGVRIIRQDVRCVRCMSYTMNTKKSGVVADD
jgi:hypothetical protein